jgi:2-succinyl-5-enolpyruvyl-6-hydroxy-3-cyclohexene-1-carboxylate synthase
VVTDRGWSDPQATAEVVMEAEPLAVAERLSRSVRATGDLDPALGGARKAWRAALLKADHAVHDAIERVLEREPFSEAHALHALGQALPGESLLILGNSLPIRAANAFLSAPARRIVTLTQRGASGIDGMVAGAVGAAKRATRPTTLVVGDVTLAHDLGSLQLLGGHPCGLCIVVLDNRGGRIFEQLPWGAIDQAQREFWLTRPALDLERLCAAFGVGYDQAPNAAAVQRTVTEAHRLSEPRMVHVPVAKGGYRDVTRAIAAELTN